MKNELYENIQKIDTVRAILVGLNTDKSDDEFERSMDELKELTKAIDIEVASVVTQSLNSPDNSTYIGSGKVQEIAAALDILDVSIIIFNDSLSPMQVRNLEKILDTEVIDRTGLILQIFAKRAKTREARLQVESAQLQYMLPRLVGMGKTLSRQGGGSGRLSNKGSGEKQLELDRRRIEHRMSELRRELENVERERNTQRNRRLSSPIGRVSLVGYTNAGKSTIMNNLLRLYGGESDTDKTVLEKDMLFATLDTSVRKIEAPGHRPFLLTDTVGFISELPHALVKAFKSTLEEAKYADVLLQVIDFSDPEYRYHMEITGKTLSEIGAGDIPVIYVFNKSDIVRQQQEEENMLVMDVPRAMDDRIYICAKDDDSLEELVSLIEKKLGEKETECELLFPYSEGGTISMLTERGVVKNTEYLPEGIKVVATLSHGDMSKYDKYLT
ncbi:GTPase HflX [Butyrivibrio sp. X503]|uniref:GTPase HflX n=1 Tax=Butyrivibrio sp. X503 TaxID=2364878 RepID=UPI000EA93C2D|nr:GTPase HflX [Butyrivibrio sp. X503]RKM58023.1 GTPase HflX [Butyrivibrio sp. X503]